MYYLYLFKYFYLKFYDLYTYIDFFKEGRRIMDKGSLNIFHKISKKFQTQSVNNTNRFNVLYKILNVYTNA